MARILGIGNALVDIMIRIPNDVILEELGLPKGSMQLVDLQTSGRVLRATDHLKKKVSSGGSAANTICGLAKMGIETAFIGKIGMDEFGRAFQDDLVQSGARPIMFFSNTHSGRAVALISTDSERTFATHLGAAVELNASDLHESLFHDYDYLHVEGYLVQNRPLLLKVLKLARENKLKVSLDMASYNVVEQNKSFLEPVISEFVDILFANGDEARALTGLEPVPALDLLGGLCDIAIVKLGEQGSLIRHCNKVFEIKAVKAKSIDTTGAGDLYASGFLYGLTRGHPVETCGHLGSLLAGKIIEMVGAKMDENQWMKIRQELQDI